jgi:uncharacterized membrane protein YsdA (DUF1294 family)
MIRLHTMIGLTGYRTRDLLRIRRALYRLPEKALFTYCLFVGSVTSVLTY